MVGVEDDRLALAELVIEHPGEAGVPAFGQASHHLRADRALLVVIDVEVLRLEHLEVEGLVDHLVSAKIPAGLRLQRGGGGTREDRERGKRDERVSSAKHTSSTRRPLLSTCPGSCAPGAVSPRGPQAVRGCRKLPEAPGLRYSGLVTTPARLVTTLARPRCGQGHTSRQPVGRSPDRQQRRMNPPSVSRARPAAGSSVKGPATTRYMFP